MPRSAVSADLVELAEAYALAQKARDPFMAGHPLEAVQLINIALAIVLTLQRAPETKFTAHEALFAARGAFNLSKTLWLSSEIAAALTALEKPD